MNVDKERLLELAEGNPGAITALVEIAITLEDVEIAMVMSKIEECSTLRGTNLYVMWSDLCDRDVHKVKTLCENCPSEILEDASRRQDYSGVSLIKDYI